MSDQEVGRTSFSIRVAFARFAIVGLTIVAAGWAVLRAAPQSIDRRVDAALCTYPASGIDQVAIVYCGDSRSVVGVLYYAQTLVPADPGTRASGGPIPTIPGATVRGTLRISKGWFGSTEFIFVAEDGITTALKEENRYLGGIVESL